MTARIGVALAALVLLAGCTSSGGAAPSPSPSSSSPSAVRSTPSALPTTPIVTGPTTAADAPSCPYVTENFVRQTMGMRLARVTVLHSGGAVVGCRFYAIQGTALAESEHLPGPDQPAVEITTQRYASADAAHNAFVRTAQAGTNPTQVQLSDGLTGVCFQTAFYPKDHGTDYGCAINQGSTALLVRTVDTTGTYSTSTVTSAVLAKL